MARKRAARSSETSATTVDRVDVSASFRSADLTGPCRNHPLVVGQWFYVLPTELWDRLVRTLGASRWDADLLAPEREAARQADSLPGCVGFQDGRPILDAYLRPTPSLNLNQPLVADYFARCAADGVRCDDLMTALTERVPALCEPQQAYLGWLFSHPE